VVSTVYGFVPQFSERPEVYSFPNPWKSQNFGINGEPRRSPKRVEWLVIDRTVLGLPEAELLDRILGRGDFRVVYERDDVLVARRRS
jgi:hypothetical protein